MPRRTQGQNARTVYIEEKFAEEAQRRNYNAESLLKKPKTNAKRKLVENQLCRQFATVGPREKQYYQYIAEKKWPLWFERCNAQVGLNHFFPGPERVIQFEHNHFTQNKRYDPPRNRFLARERALDHATKRRFSNFQRKIRRARGLFHPPNANVPAALAPPNNRAGGLGNLNLEDATANAAGEPSKFKNVPGTGTWKFHRHIHRKANRENTFLALQVLIYRRTDDYDRTTDTIVLKKEQAMANNTRVNPGRNRISTEEGQVHSMLYAACPRYVVALFDHSLGSRLINQENGSKKPLRRGIKRLLTEWVPHGNLVAFLHYYLESGHLVPEPFIWYCFKVLTEVALVCWNGQASATTAPGWEHIVNTDIKPDNIWLGAPDPTEPMEWARRYPQPKVGDFGMAYRTHNGLDDRNHEDRERRRANPPDFQGFGTRGHMPPELFHRNVRDNFQYGHVPARAQQTVDRLNADLPHTPLPWPDPWPADVPPDNSGVHSWTMVWEIGMIIWCMLATMPYGCRDVGQGINYSLDIVVDFSGGPRHDLPPRVESGGNPLRPAYSGRLVELAFRCLEVLPTDRIDLVDLWREVCEGCDDVGAQFVDANGNRTWPNPVTYVPDKYPLGQNVLNDYT
ncbi:hypothetical protein SLS58_004719 [Diplodia intermedia]|uniref:Protein kinase domain-containing protein n=1 Tax=Diplodia intermedia TaxID=856260 RepID=A0ABR3TTN0_9PEZI